jgi:DNA-damage-inducible protein J
MAKTGVLQVRVDTDVRDRADALFARLGIDTPTAVRMFLVQALGHDGLPFAVMDPHAPNAETRRAIEDAREGRTSRPYESAREMVEAMTAQGDG